MSKLPKIRDEERESQFGYVHGVSGPGWLAHKNIYYYINMKVGYSCLATAFWLPVDCPTEFILTEHCVCVCSGDSHSHGGSSYVRAGPCRPLWAGGRDYQAGGRHGHHPGLRGDMYPFDHVTFQSLPLLDVAAFILIHCVAALRCTFFQDNQFDSIRGHKWDKREEWVMRGEVCV